MRTTSRRFRSFSDEVKEMKGAIRAGDRQIAGEFSLLHIDVPRPTESGGGDLVEQMTQHGPR
jgi:hypothetical protein